MYGDASMAMDGTILSSFLSTGPNLGLIYSKYQLSINLQQVQSSFIGDITWLDHAQIGMQYGSRPSNASRGHCKLNPFLLMDPKNVQLIEEAHKNYLMVNDVNGKDKFVVWKAYKVYMRGVLIELSARANKCRNAKIDSL